MGLALVQVMQQPIWMARSVCSLQRVFSFRSIIINYEHRPNNNEHHHHHYELGYRYYEYHYH
jgi:hypothetical protein